MNTAPIMEMRDGWVAYQGDISILRGLNLRIAEGQITGIIGPNGAGKSTALKALYGLLRLQRGSIYLDGRDVTGTPPHDFVRHGVAYVPQHRSLFDDLSVEDNLKLGCWSFRRDRARMAEAVERAYARFPALAERRRARAGTLSGGQQRFLELARAMVLEPRIMMLDEPTAMIAPRISQELYDFIAELPSHGITVVLVDQNVRSCVRVSDYIYVLELGQNRAEGRAEDLKSDTALREMIAGWLEYRID